MSSFTVSAGKIHYLEILRLHLLKRNYCHKGVTLIIVCPAQEKAFAVILPSCSFCCSVECVFDHILVLVLIDIICRNLRDCDEGFCKPMIYIPILKNE